jgi:DeoR family galactitol utilization operon repressor
LVRDDSLSVNDISRQLGVSQVTVRSSLNSLSEKGYVSRTWGGATPALHPDVLERQRSNTEAKTRIARLAAELVPDGATVMIEAGTTTAGLCKNLLGKRSVHLVTNSSLVLPFARSNPQLTVTLVGGEFRPATESFVGPLALSALERFHVQLAFVGTDGFTAADGLTTHLVEGAEIVKAMSQASDRTVLLADSSKYGRLGFARVLGLGEIDTIITDSGLAERARNELMDTGPDIILA